MNNIANINEMLPFLIPLVLIELILFIITLRHIFTHNTYKHGNRAIWLAVTIIGINFVGPILYFLLGREDA